LVATWIEASAKGDLPTVLELMDEDVVFLTPGRPPMRGRETFAHAFQSMRDFRMEGRSEIQEIEVSGDWAYCWTRLSVKVTPVLGGEVRHRSGHTLSVLRRQPSGNWVLVRDANLLADVPVAG
jgi:uncharacterized protein (TIGR02246 family)